MEEIKLIRKNCIVRYGTEEFAKFVTDKSLRENVIATEEKLSSRGFIEISLPLHAGSYALIGYEFIPKSSNDLSIEVLINKDKNLLQDTISNSKTDTYIGINEEYAKIIINNIVEYFESRKTPKGKLKICMGAYSEVCSSPIMFSITTKILMECFIMDKELKIEEVRDVCEKYLSKRFQK